MLAVRTAQLTSERLRDDLLVWEENKWSAVFIDVIDGAYWHRFFICVSVMNDPNESIMPLEDLDNYVVVCERAFPRLCLWANWTNLRNVNGNGTDSDALLIPARKRQVLIQLLVFKRMRNPKKLVWFALVQAVAYYGWAVGRTALDATSFGRVSSAGRDSSQLP